MFLDVRDREVTSPLIPLQLRWEDLDAILALPEPVPRDLLPFALVQDSLYGKLLAAWLDLQALPGDRRHVALTGYEFSLLWAWCRTIPTEYRVDARRWLGLAHEISAAWKGMQHADDAPPFADAQGGAQSSRGMTGVAQGGADASSR